MNEVKYFIRNLKNYMMENNIKTERELAAKLGCSQPTVHNTLTENTPLTMGFITKTAEATGMSIVQLFSPDPKQYGSAVEDVQDGNAVAMMELMKKQMEELKENNLSLVQQLHDREEASQVRMDLEGRLRKHIAELKEENEALAQENLRLVSEGYNTENKPVKFDKWNLFVDSTDCTGIIDIGGDQIEVYDVADIDPYEKKVLVKLYFDEIIIK